MNGTFEFLDQFYHALVPRNPSGAVDRTRSTRVQDQRLSMTVHVIG